MMREYCKIVRGWRAVPATPSTYSTPAGATDAGRQSWYSAGTGLAARPQGTPASGGDGCRRIAPFGSGVAERQRHEFGALPRLHPEQHGVLAVLAGIRQALADIRGRRDRLAA